MFTWIVTLLEMAPQVVHDGDSSLKSVRASENVKQMAKTELVLNISINQSDCSNFKYHLSVLHVYNCSCIDVKDQFCSLQRTYPPETLRPHAGTSYSGFPAP